jgi:hypothetical protein
MQANTKLALSLTRAHVQASLNHRANACSCLILLRKKFHWCRIIQLLKIVEKGIKLKVSLEII